MDTVALRQEIRRLRAEYHSHEQIINYLKIPERTYYYHWKFIKTENEQEYDKLTASEIRAEIDRCRAGLEQDILDCNRIIENPDTTDSAKVSALDLRASLRTDLVRLLRDGADIVDERSRHKETTDKGQERHAKQ